MWELACRKLRELRGWQWEAATERERHREAEKRARAELASCIEKESGHRPADRTLRRHPTGTAPRGVDAEKMQRQDAIDDAGIVAKSRRLRAPAISAGLKTLWERWRPINSRGSRILNAYLRSLKCLNSPLFNNC
jgi:hypothetical protein